MLEPLRERLHDFQSKVETTYASEAREILSLKEQIKLIVETSHAIGTQADGLAKALRGNRSCSAGGVSLHLNASSRRRASRKAGNTSPRGEG